MNKRLFIFYLLCCIVFVFFQETEAAQAVNESLPFKKDSYSIGFLLFRVVLVLALISAIAYGVAYSIKRFYRGKSFSKLHDEQIQLLEYKRISGNLHIIRLQIRESEVCLAQSGNTITIIERFADSIKQPEKDNETV